MNLGNTVGMITGQKSVQVIKTGKWPCGYCGKGVGANSIKCKQCNKWCHQRCSGLKKLKGGEDFQCPGCKEGTTSNSINKEKDFTINGGKLEVVEEFRYLGDVLDNDAGMERAVRARVATAWTKWREIAGLLLNKNIPLKTRGEMYDICVRSAMLYGAETWAMTGATENIMKRSDRRMLRYIAGVKWQDGVTSEEIAKA